MYKLLMVEKGIRGGIYHAIHEIMIKKKKKSSYLKYWEVNNLCG